MITEDKYESLYTLPVHEGGYNTGKYFKRKLAITNYNDFTTLVNMCNEKGYDAYISDYGFEHNPGEEDTLDTAIIDKLFFDFDGDDLEKVEVAMYRFNKQIEDYFQCKNIIIDSGRKGYHIYMMLEQPRIISQKVLRSVLTWIKQKFKPEYLDENVVSNPKRLIRIPGSLNRKGQRQCEIITDNFEASSYINLIINKQERIIHQEEKILETKMKLQQQKQKVKMMRNETNEDEIKNWAVMDKIFPYFYETGTHTHGTKHIVKCPFHNDNNPSAFYTDVNFYCSTCNLNLGVWKFLTDKLEMNQEKALNLIRKFQ